MPKATAYVEQCVKFHNFGDGWKAFFADVPWSTDEGKASEKWYKIRIPVPSELFPEAFDGDVTVEPVEKSHDR